ncbi:MAG: non-ribosomal peptide synthetase, partial [Planctomycetota bacterium]
LGIMRCGATYVPLDPGYPAQRLRMMMETAECRFVITDSSNHSLVASFENESGDTHCLIAEDLIAPESDTSKKNAGSWTLPVVSDDATAYVIFTSGSTGQPKGVQIVHRSAMNLLRWMNDTFALQPGDVVSALIPLSFDMSIGEWFLPMFSGASLAVADDSTIRDGRRLADWLSDQRVRLMAATPATYRMLLASDWSGSDQLTIISAGEAFPPELRQPLLQRTKSVWNLYGPTETTVYSTAQEIQSENEAISIGRPIANTQVRVLDGHGHLVLPTVSGHLHISGAGVAKGYLQLPERTAQSFRDHRWFDPFANDVNWRLYDTGDRVAWSEDGRLIYAGRNDRQIKIRGHRVEIDEVQQAVLRASVGFAEQCVVRLQTIDDVPQLIAFLLVSRPDSAVPTRRELRQALSDLLPEYMIPTRFECVSSFPMTSSGKIDSAALSVPVQEPRELPADESAASDVQTNAWFESHCVHRVVSRLLDSDDVRHDDQFFDLGGHSLLVIQAIQALKEETGVRLEPVHWMTETLGDLARRIDNQVLEKEKDVNPSPTPDETNPNGSPFANLRGFWS